MDEIECIVIGAGVVGLAIARELAEQGREVMILEAEEAFGTMTSSRNSEVIHAGIYYPQGSLKAKFCVEGKEMLYDFAKTHGVAHRRCGKLIVATSSAQLDQLEQIIRHAKSAGVDDLQKLSRAEAQALEPELECEGALLSPSTGIVDSHELMFSLLGIAETHGAMLCTNSPVVSLAAVEGGFEVEAQDRVSGESTRLRCRILINSAGHQAPELAGMIAALPKEMVPKAHYARGNYFSLAGRPAFSRLIYPVPEPGGLGVHLTLDLGGSMRFGPDVEWIDDLDYRVNPARAAHFESEIRRYWPGLPDNALAATYCGIRPKISGPGETAADFRIDGPEQHGIAGLVNLYGIESPGLTSSLAIARHIAEGLARQD